MILDNYVKAQINRMAKATRTPLTNRHMEILAYAYKYYEKNKVGPLYLKLKNNLNTTKDELKALFPFGLNSVYTWVGIPIQSVDNSCKPPADIYADDFRKVYFDHNATTYIRPEVAKLLNKYNLGYFGFANPSSSTKAGKKAFDLINNTREYLAALLNVHSEEIIFTGSGSEANNLAIKGIAFKHLENKGHIITSKTEHPSILKTMEFLSTLGFKITYIDVTEKGFVKIEEIKNAIKKNTILVSIIYVNNEIGTINNIQKIASICNEKEIPFMTDAVQAFGKIEINPKEMGIDLMTFSGHKIYAPKGIGGLYINNKIKLTPLIHGGDQEMGYRAGTENVGYIIALELAAKIAHLEIKTEKERLTILRNYFLEGLKKIEPNFEINGSLENRLPNNLSIALPGIDSGAFLLTLTKLGISASAGSACSAGRIKTSHVLEAIGADTINYGTIRFGFGLKTTKDDIDYFFEYLPEILDQIREK